jgi:protein-tyrosine phosphatase
MTRVRRLDWAALVNARDVGGYPTTDGRSIRWGALVRSDSLSSLTPAGRDALIACGVRTVIDLRMPMEIERAPNPFADRRDDGIAYHNVSFIDPAVEPRRKPSPWPTTTRGCFGASARR